TKVYKSDPSRGIYVPKIYLDEASSSYQIRIPCVRSISRGTLEACSSMLTVHPRASAAKLLHRLRLWPGSRCLFDRVDWPLALGCPRFRFVNLMIRSMPAGDFGLLPLVGRVLDRTLAGDLGRSPCPFLWHPPYFLFSRDLLYLG
ncbi:hypothetical protein GW17_00034253, partial [Ensete ventricosum]